MASSLIEVVFLVVGVGNELGQRCYGYLFDGIADIIKDVVEDLVPELAHLDRHDGYLNFRHKNYLLYLSISV